MTNPVAALLVSPNKFRGQAAFGIRLGCANLITVLLKECAVPLRVRLVKFDCHPNHSLRMRELGLRPGVEMTITQKAAFGGRVININGSRLAVDSGSAAKIEVEPLEQNSAADTKETVSVEGGKA